jgi:hypothetical protein
MTKYEERRRFMTTVIFRILVKFSSVSVSQLKKEFDDLWGEIIDLDT